ncbi:hypothetical protein GMORB2_0460 [Geosmithia morbida]|uniref:DUF292-domain-containing protein n=1 Tax=Geosmithia morbida TaxID=1094350 RepID=A0A9P5D3Y2_9HYPO|nr:uncharacterized protein GMORB2_0460 [Geosmithia morbida]KAF4126723.1 hypothetical protein GMORB2_0460 [Geosmithia morbida]
MAPGAGYTTKLKVQLKLAISRLRMIQQRDEQLGKTARRSMAQLLEAGKVDSATIRVENIIRSDIITELHEILELYCELLLARAGLLDAPTCDPGLEEAVKSIIYAAPKTEIKELNVVRNLLADKFGKEFALAAMDNSDGRVNEKVIRKLSVEPPRPELVQGYLEEIARAYGVDWPKRKAVTPPPAPEFDDGDDEPSGGETVKNKRNAAEEEAEEEASSAAAKGTTRPAVSSTPSKKKTSFDVGPASPLTVTPPRMTTDNVHPKVTLGSVEIKPSDKAPQVRKKSEPEGSVPEIGDLERRFAALKRG